MSTKNKLQNKKLRKADRGAGDTAWSQFTRTPLSQFPRSAAVNVLANCKNKSTTPRRKRMARALLSIINVPRTEQKDPAVKLTVDLQRLPIVRLIRVIKKSARHAATCRYLIDQCKTESLKKNLVAAQTFHLGVMKQAQAEYNVRTQSRA